MNHDANFEMSVHQRLLNQARKRNRPFNEILQYYAMERFLFRLSQSPHAGEFVLKGALMLRVWNADQPRPTMDIDLLGKMTRSGEEMVSVVRDVLKTDIPPDGLHFDPDTVRARNIREHAAYEGVRVRFKGNLGNARITLQLDIGFADVVIPEPQHSVLPGILDFQEPSLLGYTRESAIAEKFECMIRLGSVNSRMKDFYDIWMLSGQYEFEEVILANAIRATFERRKTVLQSEIISFSPDYVSDMQQSWTVFSERLRLSNPLPAFGRVVSQVDAFLSPVVKTVLDGVNSRRRWKPHGPWR